MSMLADRRERKKYHLVPRGKALYEDDSRFGTRMLKKMGWSEGKGLGAKENGSKEFIRVKYKHDSVGFGFEDRDDQWTQHEQHFNGLLKSLGNCSEDDSNSKQEIEKKHDDYDVEASSRVGFGFQKKNDDGGSSESKNLKTKFSGESLEKKSKESKARVHYKKFTRGKDLTRYSEKDLANIFGKKSLNDDNFETENNIQLNDEKLNLQLDTNSNSNDMKFGVITKKSEKSLEDYFKERMKKLKCKKNDCDGDHDNKNPKKIKIENETIENSLVENLKGLKKKKQKCVSNENKNDDEIQKVQICPEESTSGVTITEESTIVSKKKKKNKGKCSEDVHGKKDEISLGEKGESNENVVRDNEGNPKKNKKSKRKNVTQIDERCNEDDEKLPKKLSKKSHENIESVTNELNKIQNINENKKEDKSKKISENSQKNEHNEKNLSISENQKNENLNNSNQSNSKNNNDNLIKVFKTNAFILEKFRNVELDKFNGSNIKDICGYGFADNFQIEIQKSDKFSIERLLKLWDDDDVETMKQKYSYDYKKNDNANNGKNQENLTEKNNKIKKKWKKRKPIKLFPKL